MHRVELRTDVSKAAGLEHGSLETSSTVVLPDEIPEHVTVIFAFPGGGYCRRYYDIQFPAGGYSQAEFHASRGAVFVACDHPGVGDSTIPDAYLDHDGIARINNDTVADVMRRLEAGTDSQPIRVDKVIGLGQSYGGLLLTVMQANHRTFDGVGLLGWSGIHTVVNVSMESDPLAFGGDGLQSPLRNAWFWEDVPDEIVREDLTDYPARLKGVVPHWASATMPGGPKAISGDLAVQPGIVKDHAAAIDVPVLCLFGERDVSTDPWMEATAYRASTDVSMSVVPRMAHMHNFASTREVAWHRVHNWTACVPGRATRPKS